MAYDILSAISVLHTNGFIHCDIKPQNFLLFTQSEDDIDENSCAKLIDFGLCHPLNYNNNTQAYIKFLCGSFHYKAPELTKVFLQFN